MVGTSNFGSWNGHWYDAWFSFFGLWKPTFLYKVCWGRVAHCLRSTVRSLPSFGQRLPSRPTGWEFWGSSGNEVLVTWALMAGWWFQTCFMFHFIYGMSSQPHWLINSFQDGYSTWLFAFPALRKLDTNRHLVKVDSTVYPLNVACVRWCCFNTIERERGKEKQSLWQQRNRQKQTHLRCPSLISWKTTHW